MKKVLVAVSLLAALAACTQTNPTPPTLSKLELNFSPEGGTRLKPAATVISDETGISFTETMCDVAVSVADNTRYMKCTYIITNSTPNPLNNLVLYAYHQTGQGIGGTAIKNMSNFAFGTLTNAQTAQRFLPTHGTTATGATVNSEANLYFSTAAEIGALGAVPGGTILEYGFKANQSSITAGGTGTVTIAYKIPDSDITKNNAVQPYGFTLTFVLATDNPVRVIRSPEETTASADSRAVAGDQVVVVGWDSEFSSVGTTLRLGNVKIGTAPTNLFDTSKMSLWVPNFRSDTVKRLDSPFASAVAANATFDLPTVNAGAFAGSTPNSITFDQMGNLWAARAVEASLVKINKASLGTSPFAIAQTINVGGGAVGVTYHNGLLWVALDPFGGVTNRVRGYTLSGTLVAEFTNGLNFPANIAFDSAGNLWVSNANNNNVVMYAKSRLGNNPDNAAPTRTISNTNTATHNLQNSLRYPEGLAFDSAGNLWVANNIEGQVGTEVASVVKYTAAQLAASGNPTPTATLLVGGCQPGGIALDPFDAQLWINCQKNSGTFLEGDVRKYSIAALSGISANPATPAITYSNVTTYPGNGGLAFGLRP